MVKHNNVIPNGHFHKKWQQMVKTWFDQPARKLRRRIARSKKAALVAPRPVEGLFRPTVRCQTQKHHLKLRAGRGFSLAELKAAKIPKKEARTIGIAVDHRRKNRSTESLSTNVRRLRNYKKRLILFPKRSSKPAKQDSPKEVLAEAKQLTKSILPVRQPKLKIRHAKITEEQKKKGAFFLQRKLRADVRLLGARKKKAAEKAAQEALTKKQ